MQGRSRVSSIVHLENGPVLTNRSLELKASRRHNQNTIDRIYVWLISWENRENVTCVHIGVVKRNEQEKVNRRRNGETFSHSAFSRTIPIDFRYGTDNYTAETERGRKKQRRISRWKTAPRISIWEQNVSTYRFECRCSFRVSLELIRWTAHE